MNDRFIAGMFVAGDGTGISALTGNKDASILGVLLVLDGGPPAVCGRGDCCGRSGALDGEAGIVERDGDMLLPANSKLDLLLPLLSPRDLPLYAPGNRSSLPKISSLELIVLTFLPATCGINGKSGD